MNYKPAILVEAGRIELTDIRFKRPMPYHLAMLPNNSMCQRHLRVLLLLVILWSPYSVMTRGFHYTKVVSLLLDDTGVVKYQFCPVSYSKNWTILERMTGAAPASFDWQPNIILLYYIRLVGNDGIGPPYSGCKPDALPLS